MSVIEVTDVNFNEFLELHPIIVLDFWASWCGPCRAFAPVFRAAAETHPDLCFGKIDTDQQSQLAQGFQIRSVPTVMILREKIVVVRESGALSASTLESAIEHVRGLDMDSIRAQLSAQDAEAVAS